MAPRRQTALLPAGIGDFMRRRAFELSGLILVALAVGLVVAMASFDPSDPSFNTAGGGKVNNLLGYPGAVAADLALQTFGLASSVAVIAFIAWGLRLLRRQAVPRAPHRIAALMLTLMIAALAFEAMPIPEAWPLRNSGLGGLVGRQLMVWLAALGGGHGALTDPLIVGMVAGIAALAATAWLMSYSLAEWRAGWDRLTGLAGAVRRTQSEMPKRRKKMEPAAWPEEPAGRAEPYLGVADPAAPQIDPRPRKSRLAKPKPARRPARASQSALRLSGPDGEFQLPPLDLLQAVPENDGRNSALRPEALEQNARLLEQVLADFGIRGDIVKVRPGPVVTLYELEPAPGIKTSRVIGLADDIARSMSAISARIATIPGRSVIGIELPNAKRQTVFLRELIASRAYEQHNAALPLVMGKDIGGTPVVVDLARMPHLLVAGTTGAGKSVGLNAMVLSLLYRLPPEICKFIMIDPKMLELSIYNDIPHLMTPVVTEPKKAIVALKWTVRERGADAQGPDRFRLGNGTAGL
jgi:S-DNA-T family DNA segregation ATPase FtsK/SpoIIIE